MTLEFRPPFQIDPNAPSQKQRSLATLGQTFSDIGNTALQYGQQQKENRIQQAMLQLKQAQSQREQGAYNYEYGDPNASGGYGGGTPGGGPSPAGGLTQGTNGPQPNYSMDNGQDAYAAPGSPTAAPIDHTSHFMAWKSQGMPQTYDHPDYGGTGAHAGKNPMPPGFDYQTYSQIPGSKNRDEYRLFQKEAADSTYKQAEGRKNDAMANFYNNYKGHALDASIGTKEDQQQDRLEQQYRQQLVSIRGDSSMAKIEGQRDAAIQAYGTIDKALKEGRPLNQFEYYDTLGQLWKARTGASPSDQAIRDLDAKTFKGDVGKAMTYFTGTPAGRTTLESMQALKNFVADTGMNADKLHSGYMQTHLSAPTRLNPDRKAAIGQERGLGFQEATGYQPGQGGGMIRVRNKQTGQTGHMPAGNFDASKYDQLQ